MDKDDTSPNAERLKIQRVSPKILGIGALIFAAPPPRVFTSMVGDALQILTILAAVGIPMLVLVATYQPEDQWSFDETVAERKGNTLDLFSTKIRYGFNAVAIAIFTAFIGRSLVSWIGIHGIKTILDRAIAVLVGITAANAFERSKGMLDLLGYIHVGRNLSLYLRREDSAVDIVSKVNGLRQRQKP